MSNILPRALILFAVQAVIGWLYVWFDSSCCAVGFLLNLRTLTADVSRTVGEKIPKAHWYADHFQQAGHSGLADQLVRVNGFCLIVFILTVCVYGARTLLHTGVRLGHSKVDSTGEDIARLKQIERTALAVAFLMLWFNVVGFGLHTIGMLWFETESGRNVIAGPIFGYAALSLTLFYVGESRRYLKYQQAAAQRRGTK
jgi:hypothetical protein